MAKCEVCDREMTTADGCSIGKVHVAGKRYARVRVGYSTFDDDLEKGDRCHDCMALYGKFHHWGCDAERCPVCNRQLIFCSCEDVFIDSRDT